MQVLRGVYVRNQGEIRRQFVCGWVLYYNNLYFFVGTVTIKLPLNTGEKNCPTRGGE